MVEIVDMLIYVHTHTCVSFWQTASFIEIQNCFGWINLPHKSHVVIFSARQLWPHHMTTFHSLRSEALMEPKQHPSPWSFLTPTLFFSHSPVFSPSFSHSHTQADRHTLSLLSKSVLLAANLKSCPLHTLPCPTALLPYSPLSTVQKLEVAERRGTCRHGFWKYEQRRGAEPEGVRAVRAETQHSTAAEGLHCPAVHLQARQAHGLPEGVLWEAGEGLCLCYWNFFLGCPNPLEDRKKGNHYTLKAVEHRVLSCLPRGYCGTGQPLFT